MTHEVVKKIIDAAVNDDYAAAEKVIQELVWSAYTCGYEDGLFAAKEILNWREPPTSQQSFDKRYKTPKP